MALEDTKEPYEILFRFNTGDDGKTTIAAHQQRLRRIVLDGELIKEDVLPAEPLNLEGFPVSEIMTSVHQAAIARTAFLEGEKVGLLAEIGTLRTSHGEDMQKAKALIIELNRKILAFEKLTGKSADEVLVFDEPS